MKLINLGFFSMLLIMMSCRPSPTADETPDDTTGETENDLSGITYYDLLTQVFEDDGFSFTWKEEVLPNDFVGSLSLAEEGACGLDGCGTVLSLSNSSAMNTLEVIVNSTYDLEGNTGQITRQYIVPATGKVTIGCSHLCVEGKAYAFEREIIGSKIYQEESL